MKVSFLLPVLLLAFTPLLPGQEESPKPATKEQTIYVPFEKLEDVFGKDEQGVFLPYREFLEMWNKLNLPPKTQDTPPPVEGVLSAANYTGKVANGVAEITSKLNFEALKDGWSKLSLGTGDLSIAEAKTTALLNVADGGYEVLFPKKGSYEIDATIFGRIVNEQGRSALTLKLPRTSASKFELVVPEKGLDFTITPASAFTSTENPDGTTRLLVYFGTAPEVNISWTRKAGETALQPLLFAEARTDVRVTAGVLRTEVALNYRILRAGVESFDVVLPENQHVLSVEGQGVKDWALKPDAGGQRLHVALHAAVKDTYAFTLRLESALPPLPQQIKLPSIAAQGVERQTGTIAVTSDPELLVTMGALDGLIQQAAPTTKDGPQGFLALYRYLRLPHAGVASVRDAKPQIEAASETLLTITPETQLLRATFSLTVKRAGIFATQIELPAGFTQADATGDHVESATVAPANGVNVLEVKFSTRRSGSLSFVVTAEAPRAKADEPVTVPVFVVRDAQRHDARVGLAIHVSLKANTFNEARGDLREEDIRNLGALPIKDPALTPLTLGFRYRGTAKPAQVQFELRKPRASAEVLALVEVREALIRHAWTLAYNVEYAGVNEFSVEVPAAIADDIQIEGANIKERIKTTTADAVVWRVILQDKVLGAYELHFTHDAARGEQKQGAVAQIALHEIKPLGLFRETGQVAVIKDGNLEFTRTDAKGLELIDPKELHGPLQRDGVFLAYKYAAHPVGLQLDAAKNLYLDVPTAVVSYAVLTSVIAEDEAETTEAIYWVRNNSQQFFSVQLPSKGKLAAKLLSDAFVNGEPQQPSTRPGKNELLIRLPARQNTDTLFPVRFVYEVPSPRPGQRLGWRGTLHLDPPKLAGTDVLQSRWTLFLPRDYRYVSFTGSMREVLGPRGWDHFFGGLRFFVPDVGPALPAPITVENNEPPELPPVKSAGFDTQIQKEGVAVALRRLDDAAPIAVGYRGRGYAATVEAIAFLLALFGGVRAFAAPPIARLRYFVFVGLTALVISGAVNPRGAGFWQAIYSGVALSVVLWVAWGVLRWLGSRPLWRRTTKPPYPLTPWDAKPEDPESAPGTPC
jgi:hypothetical protein